MKFYTHDEAMLIVSLFEEVLSRYDISVPSPEDDDRDEDDMIGLYGSVYDELLDAVEERIIDIVDKKKEFTEIVKYEFSGTV